METPIGGLQVPAPPMMADDVIPTDYAVLTLCLACGVLAYLHSGPKVAGTLLALLVALFALADRGLAYAVVVGTNLALAALLAFERRQPQPRAAR